MRRKNIRNRHNLKSKHRVILRWSVASLYWCKVGSYRIVRTILGPW